MQEKKMLEERSWKEFEKTGLLLLMNQFLHIFGWAIALDVVPDNQKEVEMVLRAFPARCKFRGFKKDTAETAYSRVTKFMQDNIKDLIKEVKIEPELPVEF